MEIITNAENRKELVKALSGHFGQRSEYLGPPSFAYRIGSITVDRDAKIILEDDSMNKFCEQFGLTPSARSRISTDSGEDKQNDEMELLLVKGGTG